MGSARFKMVANALSEGIGLFASHKAQEERDRVEKQWDLALLNAREKFAQNREDRQMELRKEDLRIGAEREGARFAHQETMTGLQIGAANQRFDKEQATEADRFLQEDLNELYEQYLEEKDNAYADEKSLQQIEDRYLNNKNNRIMGHVARMAMSDNGKGAPGYRNLDSADAVASKFSSFGMHREFSKVYAPQVWENISGEGPPPPDPNQFEPSGNFYYEDRDAQGNVIGQTGAGSRGKAGMAGQPVPTFGGNQPVTPQPTNVPGSDPATVAAGRPVDMVEPGQVMPSAGFGSNLFGGEAIRNPDGSIKHPGNKDAVGMKIWEWMQRPSTEMFGQQ